MVKKEIKEDSGTGGNVRFGWSGRRWEKGHVSETFWIFEPQGLICVHWRLVIPGSGKGIEDCTLPVSVFLLPLFSIHYS